MDRGGRGEEHIERRGREAGRGGGWDIEERGKRGGEKLNRTDKREDKKRERRGE